MYTKTKTTKIKNIFKKLQAVVYNTTTLIWNKINYFRK